MARTFSAYSRGYKRSSSLFLAFAVVVAGVGGILLIFFTFLLKDKAPEEAPPPTTVVVQKEVTAEMADILVPVQDVPAGAELRREMFRQEKRPMLGVSGRVVRNFEDITGNYARSQLARGDVLTRDQLTSVRPINAITSSIPAGYRAIAISVDARSSVEGWARPGAFVDVSWASNVRGKPSMTIIVQNAKIISAERQPEQQQQQQQPGAAIPTTVTLLVTSNDASRIQLAQTSGHLTLSLRGDADHGRGSAIHSISISDLLEGPHGDKARHPSGPIVRIRSKTGQMEEFEFDNGKLVPKVE